MKKFEAVPFKSGSKGLDYLVSKIQRLPKDIVAASRSGAIPKSDEIMDRAITGMERIQNLSPDSPGAASIPAAQSIGWSVIEWLQQWSMEAQAQPLQPGMFSIDAVAGGSIGTPEASVWLSDKGEDY